MSTISRPGSMEFLTSEYPFRAAPISPTKPPKAPKIPQTVNSTTPGNQGDLLPRYPEDTLHRRNQTQGTANNEATNNQTKDLGRRRQAIQVLYPKFLFFRYILLVPYRPLTPPPFSKVRRAPTRTNCRIGITYTHTYSEFMV